MVTKNYKHHTCFGPHGILRRKGCKILRGRQCSVVVESHGLYNVAPSPTLHS